jgi:SAM-dependent methyltransferase
MISKIKRLKMLLAILWRRFKHKENRYTSLQKIFYKSGTSNHLEHNANPDYWNILLSPLKDNFRFKGGRALDFACGKGRNIENIIPLQDWITVDGADISEGNINYCKNFFDSSKSKFFCTNGINLQEIKSDYYDFIMSTIALQHIPVYEIRKSIFLDIYRVLKPGGCFTFQMGYGSDMYDAAGNKMASYYENIYDAKGTNSLHDVQITDSKDIKNDLNSLGFKEIKIKIRPSFSDLAHKEWIYVIATK